VPPDAFIQLPPTIDDWYNQSYTFDMKTAVSIPDKVFRAAEQTARRLRVSRSALYTRALEAFVEAHGDEWITQRLNEVYAEEPSDLDPVLAQMQWMALGREPW